LQSAHYAAARFRIAATEEVPPERLRAMLQALLADHFCLRLRSEASPVYLLQGPRDGAAKGWPPQQSKHTGPTAQGLVGRGKWLIGSGASTAQLADASPVTSASPMLDHTSLRGTYDFRVKSMPGVDADALARQLRRQLGLTLRSFPRNTLIIEQAERPRVTARIR
jgi:uncharacterized protein (TIGR03435 family)